MAEQELRPELGTYASYGGDLLPHKLLTNQTIEKRVCLFYIKRHQQYL